MTDEKDAWWRLYSPGIFSLPPAKALLYRNVQTPSLVSRWTFIWLLLWWLYALTMCDLPLCKEIKSATHAFRADGHSEALRLGADDCVAVLKLVACWPSSQVGWPSSGFLRWHVSCPMCLIATTLPCGVARLDICLWPGVNALVVCLPGDLCHALLFAIVALNCSCRNRPLVPQGGVIVEFVDCPSIPLFHSI